MMTAERSKPTSLYLHVPFCRSICSYCDFCHVLYNKKIADQWLDAVKTEMIEKQINPKLETIYIGGGTPSVLSVGQLKRLLGYLLPYTQYVKEYTIEINPETLNEEKAKLFAEYGINRASIGYQTDDRRQLKRMNRHHDSVMVLESMQLLRKYGITNISLDIMYALPAQTMEDLKQSVETALSFKPDHLSLYSLMIEENTVFGKTGVQGADEDLEADMYEWICKVLPEYGFHQYEISNFAKDGRESMHNKVYWHYEPFYGLSAGASGMENDFRYENVRSLKRYIEEPGACTKTMLGKKDRCFEFVMMGLRLTNGIEKERFRKRFGMELTDYYGEPIEKLKKSGELMENDTHIFCSIHGFEILNTVLEEFLP